MASAVEEDMFDNVGEVREISPDGGPDDVMAGRMNGQEDDHRIGASILLHAMAGDQFNIRAFGYYESDNVDDYNVHATPENMLSSVMGILSGNISEAVQEGAESVVEKLNIMLTPENYAIYEDMKQQATDVNYPRAYLNYLVFNEDMQLQPEQCHIEQLKGTPNQWTVWRLMAVAV